MAKFGQYTRDILINTHYQVNRFNISQGIKLKKHRFVTFQAESRSKISIKYHTISRSYSVVKSNVDQHPTVQGHASSKRISREFKTMG